jgi:hypothetical protein
VTARAVRLVPPLRQAPAAVPFWVVDGLGEAPAAGDLLCLVPPLPADGLAWDSTNQANREVIELALPGIGARYLGGIARVAAGGGWRLPELTALIIEIESRCTYCVAASTLGQLGAPRGRRLPSSRVPALRWSHRGWTSTAAGGAGLVAVVRGASSGRALCICAASGGRPPRVISRRLDELARSGIGIGRMRSGTAGLLGAAWAVEVLGAPRITASQLAALREQFASAPGCGWCGLPVVGTHCRRCSPGAP